MIFIDTEASGLELDGLGIKLQIQPYSYTCAVGNEFPGSCTVASKKHTQSQIYIKLSASATSTERHSFAHVDGGIVVFEKHFTALL